MNLWQNHTTTHVQIKRAIFLLVALTFAAGCRAFSVLMLGNPQPDPHTGCIKGRKPTTLTAILVDTTDRLSVIQRNYVADKLQDRIDKTPDGGEVALYTVGSIDDKLLTAEADVCNPGSGNDENPLHGNARLMKRRWRRIFADKLRNVLQGLLSSPDSTTSPIMESLQSISVGLFEKERYDGVPKKLIIVSDMVQNTAGFSQYRNDVSFRKFETDPYYLQVRPELENVNVSILYLRRPATRRIQTPEHIEFWRDYFTDSGVKSLSVDSVEG
jgi:hypothetical protein